MSTVISRKHARDKVHEGNVDLDGLRNEILNFTEHGQVVLGLDVLRVRSVQARNEPTERGNAHSLPDTKHTRVNVRRARFKRTVRVGDG